MFRAISRTAGADTIDLSELDRVYAVSGEVGRGAMAVVYRARHRAAGHEVAIKVVRARHLDDREVAGRLVRESQLVARLDHPSIVRHFETRRLQGGHLAIVMQFVDGRTLQAHAAKRRMRTSEVEAVLRQVGDALRHSHEAGVVHRDVKPANILVDQRTRRALLSDFGIAKALHGAHDATATGLAVGTPAFMAPEQFVGAAVDGRADQYALALVGWSLLAGREPWEGAQLYELMYRQQHEPLPSAATLRRDVPPRLALAIDIGLRKDPRARFHSMGPFLLQLASDEPTEETRRLSALTIAAARSAPPSKPTGPVPQGETLAFERAAPARHDEQSSEAAVEQEDRANLAAGVDADDATGEADASTVAAYDEVERVVLDAPAIEPRFRPLAHVLGVPLRTAALLVALGIAIGVVGTLAVASLDSSSDPSAEYEPMLPAP